MYQWDRIQKNKTTYPLKVVIKAVNHYLDFYRELELPRLIDCLVGFDAIVSSNPQYQNEPCLAAFRKIKENYKNMLELKVRLEQPKYLEKIKTNTSITFSMPPDDFIGSFDLRFVKKRAAQFRAYLTQFQADIIKACEANEDAFFATYPYRHSMSLSVMSTVIVTTFLLALAMSYFYKKDKPLLNHAVFISLMALNLLFGLRLNSQKEREKFIGDIKKLDVMIRTVESVLNKTPFYQPTLAADSVRYPCDALRSERIGVGLVLFSMKDRRSRRDVESEMPIRRSPRSVSFNK